MAVGGLLLCQADNSPPLGRTAKRSHPPKESCGRRGGGFNQGPPSTAVSSARWPGACARPGGTGLAPVARRALVRPPPRPRGRSSTLELGADRRAGAE